MESSAEESQEWLEAREIGNSIEENTGGEVGRLHIGGSNG